MSDSLFQVTGIASGISWDSIIEKTIEQSKKPATIWQSKIDTLDIKRTLYQDLSSKFYTLRNTLTPLTLAATYKNKVAEFAVLSSGKEAAGIVKATNVNADAEIASWKIKVDQVAVAQRHISERVDNPSSELGIEGEFRIQVGQAYTTVKIEATDTLYTINRKLQNLTDQEGNEMAVTSKLIDNHLVVESLLTGVNNTGAKEIESIIQGEDDYMYLPRSANGTYPTQLYSVSVNTQEDGTGTNNYYYEGQDFTYDSANGKITWLKTADAKRPAAGDKVDIEYAHVISDMKRGGGTDDVLKALPTGADYQDQDPANYEIYDNTTNKKYVYGTDYMLDFTNPTQPTVRWLSGGEAPSTGNSYTVIIGTKHSDDFSVKRAGGDRTGLLANQDYFIASQFTDKKTTWPLWAGAESGAPMPADWNPAEHYEIYNKNGEKYSYGTGPDDDYTIIFWDGSALVDPPIIEWNAGRGPADNETYTLRTRPNTEYSTNMNQIYFEFDRTETNGVVDPLSKSVLAQLGFITVDDNLDTWDWREGSVSEAQDAVFWLDGVKITRTENKLENDPIANVTLELVSPGEVQMDITSDATAAIEAMTAFIEAYNEVINWINTYVNEKMDANTISTDDDANDYLQDILKESKGSTVFGVLHGDTMLWNIKNQMRNLIANPITLFANTVSTRSVNDPKQPMYSEGSFYINVGVQVARIDVKPTDSLQDIRRKIEESRNIYSQNGTSQLGDEMNLQADIVDGRLVIKTPSSTTGVSKTIEDSLSRTPGQDWDILPYYVNEGEPANGQFNVVTGYDDNNKPIYLEREGNYSLESVEDDKGNLVTRINWLNPSTKPQDKRTAQISYTYNPSTISYQVLPDSKDMSFLSLHYDSSSAQLSTFGVTTEEVDFGKSGLLVFDEDKLFNAISEDSDIVAKSMMTFFRGMNTYIGSLVDSSNTVVAGQIVPKGRIAGALKSIDTEISGLSTQISNLERQLEQRQKDMYKRYSDMEMAIQKMNAQMSSMSQYFSNTSNSSSS